jgi:hypothetical protein
LALIGSSETLCPNPPHRAGRARVNDFRIITSGGTHPLAIPSNKSGVGTIDAHKRAEDCHV